MNLVGLSSDTIPVNDRAYNYGDGCFTTLRVSSGKIEFLRCHIRRLEKSCHVLHIPFKDWVTLKSQLIHDAQQLLSGVLKVVISRGSGGRGYNPAGAEQPRLSITTHNQPEVYAKWQKEGITLGTSPIELACQPLLAGIKHLNRLEQVLIKEALNHADVDDFLVTNTHDEIVETSMANIFWRKDQDWFTPDLSQSGVEGVIRKQVMDFMESNKLRCHIVKESPTTLYGAAEVFICNSLMGLVPVKQYKHTHGDVTSYCSSHLDQIQQWLTRHRHE